MHDAGAVHHVGEHAGGRVAFRHRVEFGEQVGFARAVSDGVAVAYLADVYVLPGHQGHGLGRELVAEMVARGPYAHVRWLLHTRDAHGLYGQFGFGPPGERLMERQQHG